MIEPATDDVTIPGFLGPVTEFTRAIAAFDWSTTQLGAIEDWPGELRAAVTLMIGSDHPSAIWWGSELWLIHNEAYERDLLRERGRRLGQKFDEVWGEVAAVIRPQFDAVLASGHGTTWIDERVDLFRDSALTETYWNYSFNPLLDRDGRTLGIFNGARETTEQVFARRFDALMIALDDELLASTSSEAIITSALKLIGEQLRAPRVGFAEVDAAAGVLDIRRTWTDGAMPDISGRYPLGSFGRISQELRAGKAVVIEDNLTDPRTEDFDTRAIYARIKLRAGIVVPIIDRGVYAGGIFVQDREPRRWTPHEVALVEAAAQRLWQALQRVRSDIALRESEQRYRLIFEQADDIIFTADLDQRLTDCNRAGAAVLGYERDEIIGRSIADFVSPADFAQTTAMLRTKIENGGNTRHEVTVIGRDGHKMRWDNNSTLIVDRDDKPIGLLSISRDVTERRAFEERQQLLINELNHRVKNTLALVQSIAHQSFRSGVDLKEAQPHFLARIQTLAAAHDLLTREHWEGVTLAELVRAGTAALEPDRVAAGGSAITLTPKAAVAIAMALHELGTNAVKYGALSVPAGRVDIVWRRDGDRVCVDWHERGGPPVTVPTRRGFGVKMIERALASDLRGTVTIDFAHDGVRCAIEAPSHGNVV